MKELFNDFTDVILETIGIIEKKTTDESNWPPHKNDFTIYGDSPLNKSEKSLNKDGKYKIFPGKDILFVKMNSDTELLKNLKKQTEKQKNDIEIRAREITSITEKIKIGAPDSYSNIIKLLKNNTELKNNRIIMAGLPSSGKTGLLYGIYNNMIDRQIKDIESCKKNNTKSLIWQLPLLLQGVHIKNQGLIQSIADIIKKSYKISISNELIKEAILQGYFVLLIDGIDEWTEDYSLSTSTQLLSDFLLLVGKTGQFVCTADIRFFSFDMFNFKNLTGVGQRFVLAEDIHFIEIEPFVNESDNYDIKKLLNKLPFINKNLDTKNNAEWIFEETMKENINNWIKIQDNFGELNPARKKSLLHKIALKIYELNQTTIPFKILREDIVFDVLPEEARQINNVNNAIAAIFESKLFKGSEKQGLRFSSQIFWEFSLIDSLVSIVVTEGIEDKFIKALSKGIFFQRLSIFFWLNRDIKKQNRIALLNRIKRLLQTNDKLSGSSERNRKLGLINLISSYERFNYRTENEKIKMPENIKLSGMNLTEVYFSNMVITSWDFRRSDLTNALFSNCIIENCDFTGSYAPALTIDKNKGIESCNFSTARLTGSYFDIDKINSLFFSRADLIAAKIKAKEDLNKMSPFKQTLIYNAAIKIGNKQIKDISSDFDIDLLSSSLISKNFFILGNKFMIYYNNEEIPTILDTYKDRELKLKEKKIQIEKIENVKYLGKQGLIHYFFIFTDIDNSLVEYNEKRNEIVLLFQEKSKVNDALLLTQNKEIILICKEELKRFNLKLKEEKTVKINYNIDKIFITSNANELIGISDKDILRIRFTSKEDAVAVDLLTTLEKKPSNITLTNHELAVAYSDNSVELFSLRFGLISRLKHSLSFDKIYGLYFESSQALLYIFGEWRVKKGEKKTMGVCGIDSQTGNLLLYFSITKKMEIKGVKERLKELFNTLIDSDITNEKMSLDDLNNGYINNNLQSAEYILNNIELSIEQAITYEEGIDLKVSFSLSFKKDSKLNELYTYYNFLNMKGGHSLLPEILLTKPDGSVLSVSFEKIKIKKGNNKEPLLCDFFHNFRNRGNYKLRISLFLGNGTKNFKTKTLRIRPQNPYNAQSYITDKNRDMWVGDEELNRIIESAIKKCNETCVTIVGSRRQGKSSILFEIKRRLLNSHPNILPIYLTFDKELSKKRAGLDFVNSIFTHLSENKDWPYPQKQVLKNKEEAIKAINNLKKEMKEIMGDEALLVLLCDEVNAYVGYDQPDIGTDLIGALLSTNEWMNMIACGSPLLRKPMDTTIASSFSRFLNDVSFIQPLKDEQLIQLIHKPIKGRYKVTKEAEGLILKYACSRPFDVQTLMKNAVDKIIKEERIEINKNDIDYAYNHFVVKEYTTYLKNTFQEFEKNNPNKATKWEERFSTNLLKQLKIVNKLNRDRKISYSQFYDQGFVKGYAGETLNIPAGLVSAWLETKK